MEKSVADEVVRAKDTPDRNVGDCLLAITSQITYCRPMYKKLLVPYDGSPFSARALPIAAALARRTGATLHLVLVHDPSSFIPFVAAEVAVPVYDSELEHERRGHDRRALEAQVATLASQGLLVSSRLLEGTTIEALVEYGQEIGADLTVMTTHGRGGFERLRLGSVASAYLVRATNPVLLVRGGGTDAVPVVPSGSLLCPLDGSPFSEAMIPHARAFAEALDMPMALFGVTVPHAMPMAPIGTELLADPGALEAESDGRRQYLARMLAQCPVGATANATTDLSVARAILEEAARIDAGVIAMASHGRSGLMRLVLGSVADEVVRHAELPVLLYRPES